ncbi:MAG: ATPase [Ostreibacterium sp.]
MKKSITLMGMSGVGKTTLSQKLPMNKWFHYSADYRIATYYLNDVIGDFLKAEAMKSPLIADLLKSHSIYIGAKLSIDNLAAISAYIGKLGRPDLGGLDWKTFILRQRLHCKAEIASCYDIGYFKRRAKQLYGYDYFLHDAGGSICELDNEAVIAYIANQTNFIYLYADEDLTESIIQRALDYPKPLYYNETFLTQQVRDYQENQNIVDIDDIIPNDFIRFIIPKLMQYRQQRYLDIAEKYGKIIDANDVAQVRDEADFLALLEQN